MAAALSNAKMAKPPARIAPQRTRMARFRPSRQASRYSKPQTPAMIRKPAEDLEWVMARKTQDASATDTPIQLRWPFRVKRKTRAVRAETAPAIFLWP